MRSENLKAFSVLNREHEGAIHFATSNLEARKWGAHEYNDGEWGGMHVTRFPDADQFAETGIVPAEFLIDHGWWLTCCYSGVKMDSDWYEEQGRPTSDAVGSQQGLCFACPEYEQYWKQEKAEIAHLKVIWLERMKKLLVSTFGPEALTGEHHHIYVTIRDGHYLCQQAILYFSFPGMTLNEASIRFDTDYTKIGPPDLKCHVCTGDLEVFQAWRATLQMEQSNGA
ncbi:hypothetical protein ACMG4P_04770 [Pseudovibrio denitrificans]|uniref:hypothetical protein n=1 Tax=Pseudovibrio denitrificans TaxID=258256 RepID=UPI0039BF217F